MTCRRLFIAVFALLYFASALFLQLDAAGKKASVFDLDAPGSARPSHVSPGISRLTGDTPRVEMRKTARALKGPAMGDLVQGRFRKKYNQVPRPLQIESVISLSQGINTFVLAGTGYGKTRIPQAFLDLFTAASLGIVIVINALDALGDNQVRKL